MAITRRDALVLCGASAAVLALEPAVASGATSQADRAPPREAARPPITVVSANDFLYSDRHERLYADLRVYLNGRGDNIEPFIACLQQDMDVQEICERLKLHFRGDVWFATLLVHLHMRDGLVHIPGLQVAPPGQLASKLAKLEQDWQHRNDRWFYARDHFGPPKPPPLKPVHILEEEIEALELTKQERPELASRIDRLIQRRRSEIEERS